MQSDDGLPLRLLLVEDSADDAELTAMALADAGMSVDFRRVQDESGLLAALSGFRPHVVLSDINLPGFSGEDALQLVKGWKPQVPFVYFSDGWPSEATKRHSADAHLAKTEARQLPGLLARLAIRPESGG